MKLEEPSCMTYTLTHTPIPLSLKRVVYKCRSHLRHSFIYVSSWYRVTYKEIRGSLFTFFKTVKLLTVFVVILAVLRILNEFMQKLFCA